MHISIEVVNSFLQWYAYENTCMYGKVAMTIQFEVFNSPSKHSPSHTAEKYGVGLNLEAVKIFGTILSHVFFINFPITLSSSAKICRRRQSLMKLYIIYMSMIIYLLWSS